MSIGKTQLELEKDRALYGALFHAKQVSNLSDASYVLRNIHRMDSNANAWKPAFDAMFEIGMKQVMKELAELNRHYMQYKYLEAKLNSSRLVK